jgi:hypothetical protein
LHTGNGRNLNETMKIHEGRKLHTYEELCENASNTVQTLNHKQSHVLALLANNLLFLKFHIAPFQHIQLPLQSKIK